MVSLLFLFICCFTFLVSGVNKARVQSKFLLSGTKQNKQILFSESSISPGYI